MVEEAKKNVMIYGKNVLMPYLLDRKIAVIDYIIISHFDTDHCQGLIYIMEKMKVRNVIIGKQFEDCANYQEFLKIVKKNKLKVQVVEAGNRINIEKNLYFDVLWPYTNKKISENCINNNSLVCKLVYKNFSLLFTGDIEEIAEKAILDLYKENLEILEATCLKVAHHGSKTSSIYEFLKVTRPKIALIGVGKGNLYGHPNEETLKNLKEVGAKIYRTDECGEITIESIGNSIKVKKFKNNRK